MLKVEREAALLPGKTVFLSVRVHTGDWAHRQWSQNKVFDSEQTLTNVEGGNEEKLHCLQVSILKRACTHGGLGAPTGNQHNIFDSGGKNSHKV